MPLWVRARRPLALGLPDSAISGWAASSFASSIGSLAVATMSMSLQVSVQRRAEPARTTFSEASLASSASTSSVPASRTSSSRRRSSGPSVSIRSSSTRTFSSNFAPSPFRPRSSPGLGGRLELVEGRDPGVVVDAADGLGADAGDPGQVDQRGGELLLQLPRGRDLALVEEGDDLLLDRVADPLHRRRLALLGELADGLRAVGDHPRRLLVGEDAEAVGAVELVEGSELAEGRGDLSVSHRPNLDNSEQMLRLRRPLCSACAVLPLGRGVSLGLARLSRVSISDARHASDPGRSADLQRGRQPRVDRRRRARRGAGGDGHPRRRRRLPRRHRRDRRRGSRPPTRGSTSCTGTPRRVSARPTSPASAAPSTRGRSGSSRWTPTSPTIPPTSRG